MADSDCTNPYESISGHASFREIEDRKKWPADKQEQHKQLVQQALNKPVPTGPYPYKFRGMGWVQLDFAADEKAMFLYRKNCVDPMGNLTVKLRKRANTLDHCKEITANVYQDIFDPQTQTMKRQDLPCCTKTLPGNGPFLLMGLFCLHYVSSHLCVYVCAVREAISVVLNEKYNWSQYRDAMSETFTKALTNAVEHGAHVLHSFATIATDASEEGSAARPRRRCRENVKYNVSGFFGGP